MGRTHASPTRAERKQAGQDARFAHEGPPRMTPEDLLARVERALERRRPWESVWRDCYDHALAATPGGLGGGAATLHDSTAADAAEGLAASLLAELTPPWSRWFGLAPVEPEADPDLAASLDRAADVLQGHFDRSNLTLERIRRLTPTVEDRG